jgi:hypothetical protein
MTTEEAKKAGFRHFDRDQYVYWQVAGEFIHQFHCYACSLREGDFPTRAKAREALRKRKLEAATKDDDTEHAKGMIYNNNTDKWEPDTGALDELAKQAQELHMGYETDKPCDMPDTLTISGKSYRRLKNWEDHDLSKGDLPVSGSQTHRFGSVWYRPVESHETPVGETQAAIEERIKSVPSESSETPAQKDARIKALVDGYRAKGGPITKEQLTDEVRRWLKKDSAKFYSFTLDDDRSQVLEYRFDVITWQTSAQIFWNKSDAEHARWLADMQSQTTPITPEQAKMLRDGDTWYYYNYVFKRVASCNRLTALYADQSFGRYFTRAVAQSALDKAKAEAEPPMWCEYNEGSRLSPEAFISFDDGKTWTTVTGKFIGVCYSERLGIRARYRNPTWLAKHGTDTETKPTTTPAKPHESAKVEETNPTTVRGWLETIPDPAIREAAILQCEEWSKNCTNLPASILKIWNWDLTSEGVEFWNRCYDAAYDGTPWPGYPSKAKQESDGWTQDEIDKAALKPDAVSHPSHYTSHPSGVECITITKHMNFCRGNAVKYLWRAGRKGDSLDKEIEDIAKAEEYCRIEKERLIALKGAK